MAIATGTAILIGAGVAAAGGVAKAKIDSNANKRALAVQTHAGDAALDYQKGRDTIGDQRYADAEANYQRDLAEWKTRHGYGGAAPAPGKAVSAMGGGTLRDLAGSAYPTGKVDSQPVDPSGVSSGTLENLANWNDWGPYLQPKA